jgi:hypothetical protein
MLSRQIKGSRIKESRVEKRVRKTLKTIKEGIKGTSYMMERSFKPLIGSFQNGAVATIQICTAKGKM